MVAVLVDPALCSGAPGTALPPGPAPAAAVAAVPGRALHLVDLENLLGDPWARGPEVGAAYDAYLEAANWRVGDLVFVAGNPWLMVEFGWSHARDCHRFAARGPQGADRTLLEAAPIEWVVRRFRRVSIGSGDGVFSDTAQRARSLGLDVCVVSRAGSLSGRLRATGCRIVGFDDRAGCTRAG